MNRILNQLIKNFKLVTRNKASALVILLGPVLVMLLVGLAFNTSSATIKIGVYSENYNELTESFISEIKDNQYEVVKTDSLDSCIGSIQSGRVDMCMVFPKDMELSNENRNEIEFHVDFSKINLVWMVLDVISKKLETRSEQLSLNLTNDLLAKLDSTKQEIESKKPVIVELTSKNSKIEVMGDDIMNTLGQLDLSLNKDEFHLDEARQTDAELQQAILYQQQIYISANNRLEELSTAMAKKLDDLDNETKKGYTSVLALIELEQSYLVGAPVVANESYNKSMTQRQKIMDNLDLIETELDKLSANMDKAAQTRQDVGTKVQEIKATLNDGLLLIAKLQNSFNSIENNIESIQVTDASKIVSPVTTNIIPVTAKKTNLDFTFPTLLALVLMFLCLILASSLVIMEKKSKAFFRNNITPTPSPIFILGNYVTNLVIVMAQCLVILIVAAVLFKADLGLVLHHLLFALLFAVTFFILLGMLIGYLFNSQETAMLGSVSVGSLLLFLSNTIIPIQTMPKAIQALVKLNPFVITETMLRKIAIFNSGILSYGIDIIFLVVYIAIAAALVTTAQHYLREQSVTEFRRKLSEMKAMKKMSRSQIAEFKAKIRIIESIIEEGVSAARRFKIDLAVIKHLEAKNLAEDVPFKERERLTNRLEKLNTLIKQQRRLKGVIAPSLARNTLEDDLATIEGCIQKGHIQKARLMMRKVEKAVPEGKEGAAYKEKIEHLKKVM